MKKVKFIDVEAEFDGWGAVKGNKYTFYDIKEIIEEMILDQWEYCGYIPVTLRGRRDLDTISLIFQKETEDSSE